MGNARSNEGTVDGLVYMGFENGTSTLTAAELNVPGGTVVKPAELGKGSVGVNIGVAAHTAASGAPVYVYSLD